MSGTGREGIVVLVWDAAARLFAPVWCDTFVRGSGPFSGVFRHPAARAAHSARLQAGKRGGKRGGKWGGKRVQACWGPPSPSPRGGNGRQRLPEGGERKEKQKDKKKVRKENKRKKGKERKEKIR